MTDYCGFLDLEYGGSQADLWIQGAHGGNKLPGIPSVRAASGDLQFRQVSIVFHLFSIETVILIFFQRALASFL